MVEATRLNTHGTCPRAAGHRVDVCAGHLPANGTGSDQQHGRADGRAIEVLTMLAWTIYSSFLGVAVLMLLPQGNARPARTVALLAARARVLITPARAPQPTPGPGL